MKPWITCLLTIWLAALNSVPALAANPPSGKQVELHWSELSAFLVKGEVQIVLPDGGLIRGRALAVRPDELVLLISRTPDKRAYPKGQGAIPRKLITTISYTETKGVAGRIGLTFAGVFGGMGLGWAVAYANDDSGSTAAGISILALPVALGVAGYYAGRAADRRTTLIKVLPD